MQFVLPSAPTQGFDKKTRPAGQENGSGRKPIDDDDESESESVGQLLS